MPSTVTDRLDGITTSVAVKAPVVVGSTANITLSGSTQVIDGYTPSTGERVLVMNQTDAIENGIYQVRSGTWQRQGDCDGARDLVKGTVVYVSTGSTANTNFRRFWEFDSTSSTSNTIAPGTDTMTLVAPAGLGSVSTAVTVTAFAETFLDDAASTDVHETLGLEIGINVQAQDQQLADIAAITPSTGGMLYVAAASTILQLAKGSSGQVLTQGASEPFWTAAAAQATQAAIEAETNQDTYIPPDLLNFNPGVAKAWVKWNNAGTLAANRNVSSVTDSGTGDFTINWGTDFSGTDYVAVAGADTSSASRVDTISISTAAAGTLDVNFYEANTATDTARTLSDFGSYSVVAFGDQ